jgi:glycosyltransferase 2 family protein
MIFLGILFSLVLLIILFTKIEWATFWAAMQRVVWPWLALAGTITAGGTLLRALRWNLIAGVSINRYRFFWHAASLGYLGNAIYPARAGEILRMLSIAHSTDLPMSRAVTSAVIDRMADLVMLGTITLLVAAHHGANVLGREGLFGVTALIGIALAGAVLLALKGGGYQSLVNAFAQRLPTAIGSRLPGWYSQAYDGLLPLRSRWRMTAVLTLNVVVFLFDYLAMWTGFSAFGWSLPFWAAVTMSVFIAAGTSLPSAPGYVGVYQVASVLALGLYGLDGASAVAYAIVWQLLSLLVIALLSGLSVLDGRLVALQKTQQSPVSGVDCA